MSITINVNVREDGKDGGSSVDVLKQAFAELACAQSVLQERVDELVRQMGDEIGPFPGAGIDGFLSHFILSIEFMAGPMQGQLITLQMPPAMQTVTRSDPFIYQGPSANHVISVPMPAGSSLSGQITERDFFARPDEYFIPGQETVWMQILNLDARMDTSFGPIRIILGETLQREYPDIFMPSLGVAQALGRSGGFPARLFFNPYAIIETQFGNFRAIHGTLSYGRIKGFPPAGTPVSICEVIPMQEVETVRTAMRAGMVEEIPALARIIALTHPIDTAMQMPGEEAFRLVEHAIEASGQRPAKK